MLPIRFTCSSPSGTPDRDFFFEPFEAVSRLLDRSFTCGSMNLDVREEDTRYVVEADVPGFSGQDLDITIEDGILTLTAQKATETEDHGKTYRVQERRTGKVSRSIRLPEDVEADTVTAALKDGVLTLTLEKLETAKPRKIEVKAE